MGEEITGLVAGTGGRKNKPRFVVPSIENQRRWRKREVQEFSGQYEGTKISQESNI